MRVTQVKLLVGATDEVLKVRFLNVDNRVLLIPSPVCEKMMSEHFLFQFMLLSYIYGETTGLVLFPF